MSALRRQKTLWIDIAACMLLLSILAAHVIRDPSPWTEPFYSAARFDGQAGVAGLFIQAALDQRVDHLLWPGLPMITIGGWMVDVFDLDASLQDGVADKAELYAALDQTSRYGNVVAATGVVLLVLLTYFLLRQLYTSRLLAVCLSALLAGSQSAITQLGWIRSEVWSLTFLAAALLVVAKPIRSSIASEESNHPAADSFGIWRWLACGFFLASAILARINVLFAVLATVLCIGWLVWLRRGKLLTVLPGSAAARWALVALPLLLFPWYALQQPSPEFFTGVSHYDRVTATALPPDRWLLSAVGVGVLVAAPALLAAVGVFLRKWSGRSSRIACRIDRLSLLSASLLTGGIAAFLFWCAALGGPFFQHVRHVLATLISTLNGAGPYMKGSPSLADAATYVWDAGSALGRPNGADMVSLAGWTAPSLDIVNTTSVALAAAGLALICIVPGLRGGRLRTTLAFLSLLWVILLLLTEYLGAARAQFLDFRYYAYTQWYALMAVAAAMVVAWMTVRSRIGRSLMTAAAVVLTTAATAHAAIGNLGTASQKALFGRQTEVAGLTAPSLFEQFGLEAEPADWRAEVDHWQPVAVTEPILDAVRSPQDAENHFAFSKGPEGELLITAKGGPEAGRLIMGVPFELDEETSAEPARLIVLRADVRLQQGNESGLAFVGLKVENHEHSSLTWCTVSSHWSPWSGWVTFAASTFPQGRDSELSVIISWLPKSHGDSIALRELAIGVEPLTQERNTDPIP